MNVNDTNLKPCGYYVLIRMEPVAKTSSGGIYMQTPEQLKREKVGNSVGTILEFGPAAFKGLSNGVNEPEQWGVSVGDKVEFTSYDGKQPKSAHEPDEDGENLLRLIQDQHIIAKLN